MDNWMSSIPKRFLRFLRWFCHPDHLEELEGDLLEQFTQNAKDKGINYARWRFRRDVMLLIRPSAIKKMHWDNLLSFAIYRSHFRIAIRQMLRQRAFTAINISGLAIGMCVSLLLLTLFYELKQFDRFHENRDNIYRIISQVRSQGQRLDRMATSPIPLANSLDNELDGVDQIVRIRRYFNADAKVSGKVISLEGHFADPEFLKVFSFPLIHGDINTTLSKPFQIVLTKRTATKLFGDESPMNQVVTMGPYGDFLVSGILDDPPLHSHLQFEVLGSFSSLPVLEKTMNLHSSIERWDDVYSHYVYFTLDEYTRPKLLQNDINRIAEERFAAFDNLDVHFEIQALLDIIPGPELSNRIGPSMPPITLIILSSVAFLILLSACFNYTNLSIARSFRRAREIGIRKVVGARKPQLIGQFLLESVILSTLSLFLGVLLFLAIKPGFFNIIPKVDQFSLELRPELLIWFVIFSVFTGILAGAIPSLVLSRTKPVLSLKNVISERIRRRFTWRKALITFQFAISIIFIVGALIILRQYRYAFNKDLGFNRENILNVSLYDMDYQRFYHEFSQIPEVEDISFSSVVAGLGSTNSDYVILLNTPDSMVAFNMAIDGNYLNNHGINLIAGKLFEDDIADISGNTVIVNRKFVEATPWTMEEILGELVKIQGRTYQVGGIVENFHYTHLEEPILPFFFIRDDQRYHVANLKLASPDMTKTMSALTSAWDSLEPNSSWEASFYDVQIARAYDFLKDAMTLFGFLAFMAVGIACLGMLGMAMYAAEVRAREMSIRKVFGASMWRIFHSLSAHFIILILIGGLIGLPLVYLLFDQLILANFAFRIDIGIMEMIIGLVAVLILGLVTIGSQTWRVARMNPADKLRGV